MLRPLQQGISCVRKPHYILRVSIGHGILCVDVMRAVLLKLPQELIADTQECASALGLTRSAYIRRTIEHFNRETERSLRAKKLVAVSRKVCAQSMRVNAEFARFEKDSDA